jgi:uncharacterized protein YaiE (UPF0345 family)
MTRRSVALAAAAGLLFGTGAAEAQTWRSGTATRQVHGEQRLQVEVELAAGTFLLRPGSPGTLFQSSVRYDADLFASSTTFDAAGSRLDIALKPNGEDGHFDVGDQPEQRLDLTLSPAVRTVLDLRFGAATAELELGGLSLDRATVQTGASRSVIAFSVPNRVVCHRFELEVGAAEIDVTGLGNARCEHITVTGGVGEVRLDFTGSWPESAATDAEVTIGLGTLTMRFPEGLGVAIDVERFLASFEDAGFARQGSRYVSAGFEEAGARLEIHLKAIFGDVNVEWIPAVR